MALATATRSMSVESDTSDYFESFLDDIEEDVLSTNAEVVAAASADETSELTSSSSTLRLRLNVSAVKTVGEVCHLRYGRVLGCGGFGRVVVGTLFNARRDRIGRGKRTPSTGMLVAVKFLNGPGCKPRDASKSAVLDNIRSELNAFNLKHKNVVRMLAHGWTDSDEMCDEIGECLDQTVSTAAIIMEMVGGRNLQTVLDDDEMDIDWTRRLRYATDLSSAVSYLHYRGLAHLDIKPANVLVTRSDLCKLSDFGTSRRIFPVSYGSTSDYEDEDEDSDVEGLSSADEDCCDGAEIEDEDEEPARREIINLQSGDDRQQQQLRRSRRSEQEGRCQVAVAVGGGGGTIAYRAPELLRGIPVDKVSGVRFDKADVYSVGVTLWQLLSRRTPFTNIFDSSNAIMWNVVMIRARPDGTSTKQRLQEEQQIVPTPEMLADRLTGEFVKLYKNCWDQDPSQRPVAAEVLQLLTSWQHHRSL